MISWTSLDIGLEVKREVQSIASGSERVPDVILERQHEVCTRQKDHSVID